MTFTVSSKDLLTRLQVLGRVLSSKNVLPILDNFLFSFVGNDLAVTASDLETTITTHVNIINTKWTGKVAIPAKILLDTLKNFADQPLTFDIKDTKVTIKTDSGKYNIMGQNGDEFPTVPTMLYAKEVVMTGELLYNGIERVLPAVAIDELRPVMSGVYLDAKDNKISFVGTDAHRMVVYRRALVGEPFSIVVPLKPANILKNILAKETGDISLSINHKNMRMATGDYDVTCRLVEGKFPNYESVIPKDNPCKLKVDRQGLISVLKRVSLFSSDLCLVTLKPLKDKVSVSAQDIDLSISANEDIQCNYEGDEMEIGFKGTFLLELLSNVSSPEVVIEMSDPSRAGLILPGDNEAITMLLMPMMINA